MKIADLLKHSAKAPQRGALLHLLEKKDSGSIFLQGLSGSAASLFFASLAQRVTPPFVFILNDVDEAGYFYHDLQQIKGDGGVFFFPSDGAFP